MKVGLIGVEGAPEAMSGILSMSYFPHHAYCPTGENQV